MENLGRMTIAVWVVGGALAAGPADEPLNKETWWYGNTWGGGPLAQRRWMVHSVDNIAVYSNRIYCIARWEEGGGEANIYGTDGTFFRRLDGWHSFGYHGGHAIAFDDRYVYYSMGHNSRDGGGQEYAGIARYTLDGEPAGGFPNAVDGHRFVVNDQSEKMPAGLALHDGELFVADPLNRRIAVYATDTFTLVREIPFANPGRLALDAGPERALWVLDPDHKVVRKIGRDGKDLGVTIAGLIAPMAVCIDKRTGNVLVSDIADDRMHIRRYRADTGAYVEGADFGEPIWTGPKPGAVGPARFTRIVGIDTDEDGNLYVADSDFGARLFKYDADRKEVWVLKGLEFVSCGDADPGHDTDVYTSRRRYVLDYAAAPGQGWQEAAVTLDPLRYPLDPRRNFAPEYGVRMLRLGGQKIMFGKQQMQPNLFFWRFDGEIAVPAAMYFPKGVPRHGVAPADNFGGRWTGFLVPRASGRHQIVTITDDAVRLWIDDKPVIDHWAPRGLAEDKAEVDLVAGQRYAIKIEYCNVSGPGQMRLFWQEPDKEREIVPNDVLLADADSGKRGLTARFFFGTSPSAVPDQDAKQTRIDATVDYPAFYGALDSPDFGAKPPPPIAPAWPPHNPPGPFIWSDANGDGSMQADEYQAAPEGAVNGHGTTVDDNGDIWVNTVTWEAARGQITRIPFMGLNRYGAPTWDCAKAAGQPIPADTGIHLLSKLYYDPAKDRMYIGCFTAKRPPPFPGWELMHVGTVIQCFSDWSKEPKLLWESDAHTMLPDSPSKIRKAWAFAGDYVFVGYSRRYTQLAIDVHRADDGTLVGMFLPNGLVENTGWIDMNDGIQAHLRADGTYVVFAEEVMLGKNIYFLWKP